MWTGSYWHHWLVIIFMQETRPCHDVEKILYAFSGYISDTVSGWTWVILTLSVYKKELKVELFVVSVVAMERGLFPAVSQLYLNFLQHYRENRERKIIKLQIWKLKRILFFVDNNKCKARLFIWHVSFQGKYKDLKCACFV